MPAKFKELCLDAADARAIAEWWCTAMGYELVFKAGSDRPDEWTGAIRDPSGAGPLVWINAVPEPKTLKNRMHLDVVGDTRELVAMGATLIRTGDGEDIHWDILADPEGNEFCVFTADDDG
jgi:hypothetical protein